MNCEQLRDLLNSDDAATDAALRAHLEGCPACQRAYAAHLELASTFAELDGPAPSDSFTNTVMARIAAEEDASAPTPAPAPTADRWPWLAALVGAGATCAATISLIAAGTWQPGVMPASAMPTFVSERLSSFADISTLGPEGIAIGAGITLVAAAFLRLTSGGRETHH